MNKPCLTECPGAPCLLLGAAQQIEDRLEVLDLEQEFVEEQRLQADVRVMEVDLTVGLANEANETVDGSTITGAFDQAHAADKAYFDFVHTASPIRDGGADWAARARDLSADVMAECGGPVHGIRIPFLHVILPTPSFIGKDYCSAPDADRTARQLDMGEALYGIEPDANNGPGQHRNLRSGF